MNIFYSTNSSYLKQNISIAVFNTSFSLKIKNHSFFCGKEKKRWKNPGKSVYYNLDF